MVALLQTTPRMANRHAPVAALPTRPASTRQPGTPRPADAATADLGPLAAIATPVQVAAAAPIVMEGADATHLYRVVSGVVKVYRTLADGRCQITGFLFAGDFLGFAPEDTYVYGADAIGPVTLSRFARTKVEQLVEVSPLVARLLLRRACSELIAAQDQMLLLGRKTARERVASFLLLMARRAGSDTITLPMTRAEMADYLGLTIETVSRTLTQLADDGAITVKRAEIHVLDGADLEDLADAA